MRYFNPFSQKVIKNEENISTKKLKKRRPRKKNGENKNELSQLIKLATTLIKTSLHACKLGEVGATVAESSNHHSGGAAACRQPPAK